MSASANSASPPSLRSRIIAGTATVALPILLLPALLALASNHNDVMAWLPKSERLVEATKFFARFGADENLVISWDGCTIDDPRLDVFTERMMAAELETPLAGKDLQTWKDFQQEVVEFAAEHPEFDDGLPDNEADPASLVRTNPSDSPTLLVRQVLHGREIVRQLEQRSRLSREEAIARTQGWMTGPPIPLDPPPAAEGADDANNEQPPPEVTATTCLLIIVTPTGSFRRHELVAQARAVAADLDIPADSLRLAGSTIDSVNIDTASMGRLPLMTFLCCSVGLLMSWLCLRSVPNVAAVVFSAMLAWCGSLSVVYFSGDHIDAVLIMMPGLVYVLAISGAVHLTGYDHLARERNPAATAWAAVAIGAVPCTAAALTTVLGLGSLMVSKIQPIQKFGFFSAIAVIVFLTVLMFVWPAVLATLRYYLTRRKPQDQLESAERGATTSIPQSVADTPAATGRAAWRWWLPLFRLSVNQYLGVLVVTAVFIPFGLRGIARLEASVSLQDMFFEGSRVIQDHVWLEQQLGPLAPLDISVRFPNQQPEQPEDDLFPETEADRERRMRRETEDQLVFIDELCRRIEGSTDAGTAFAATSFLPEIPTGPGMRNAAKRGATVRSFLRHRNEFVQSDLLSVEQDGTYWRIRARVSAMEGLDFSKLWDHFDRDLNTILQDMPEAEELGVETKVTGGLMLVAETQRQLLDDLIYSFSAAFALIALAMMVMLRNPASGLLAMAPNLFPAVAVLGTMGWLGIPIDIGSMMTASVALGIAVDDTTHFIYWFRQGILSGRSRRASIRFAFARCANAMLETSLICGLGILAFTISPFVPVVKFAWMMAWMLGAALVGDLIIMPALLMSPLGALFAARKPKRHA
jgi:predicted RND superfamily exporter protein